MVYEAPVVVSIGLPMAWKRDGMVPLGMGGYVGMYGRLIG